MQNDHLPATRPIPLEVYEPYEFNSPRAIVWRFRLVAVGLVALVIWAAFAEVDQVTRAQAQIVAQERTQLIQAPDGGVMTLLHVKEGDQVKAGQILVTLEKERAQAAVDDSSAKVAALGITLARLQAEVYGYPLKFATELHAYKEYIRNQTDLYNKRQIAFRDDIKALQHMLQLAEEELQMVSKLQATGDVSRAEVLRLQRSAADIRSQMVNKKNKYFQDAQAEMTKVQEELSSQTEQLRDRRQLLEHTQLVAPVQAIVNNIRVNTLGGVVRPGDTILELLPLGEQLIAEAKVPSADIAFVTMGQDASVKIDAYDSSIYGALLGQVTYISPDVLKEETQQGTLTYYRVRIAIKNPEFKGEKARDIQLRPGLSATVDIKAAERSVLSFLVKPLSKTLNDSLGER